MTKIKITHESSTYILTADFAQAADALRLDGSSTPFQVADARHSPEKAVKLVMEWLFSQSGDEGEYDWEIVDTLADHITAIRHALNSGEFVSEAAEAILNAPEDESEEDDLTPEEDARILAELLEEDSNIAPRWAEERCARHECEVIETDESTDDRMGEPDECIYVIATRELHVAEQKVAEWTICARGWYVYDKSNPNYSVGWNVDEADEGDDGIPSYSNLRKVLENLSLDDEATELPDVPEPEGAEHCSKDEATHCVLFRNPYAGQEDFTPETYHPSAEDAEKARDEAYRNFRAANSDNAYGPEWVVAVKSYRVYEQPEGCDVSFVGEYETLTEAEKAAESEESGLPRSNWETARAAGHVMGMSAPGKGVEEDEPIGWYGKQGFHYIVRTWVPVDSDE